jgi:hypothetical protein
MPRQRVSLFHCVSGRDRSGKLAANGEREHAAVFTHHVAKIVRQNRTSALPRDTHGRQIVRNV